jgi:ubiquinone/menaquinone biosynthesis C-methylase UbiE
MHLDEALARIEKAYDAPPFWYDIRGLFILTFAYRSSLWTQIAFFGSNLGPLHLEAAIGSGTLLGIILSWRRLTGRAANSEIVGFDYAPAMLAGAIRRFKASQHIRLLLADVAALDFPANHFDTANVANAMHCFPDVNGALKELCRVLKPSGTLAVNVLLFPRGMAPLRWLAEKINTWAIRKGILCTPYELVDIRARILAAGFSITSEKVSGNTLNLVAFKPASAACMKV